MKSPSGAVERPSDPVRAPTSKRDVVRGVVGGVWVGNVRRCLVRPRVTTAREGVSVPLTSAWRAERQVHPDPIDHHRHLRPPEG